MATTKQAILTAEDLFLMGEEADRQEQVRGELQPMSPAAGTHSEIWIGLATSPWIWVKPRRLGQVYGAGTGFIISRNPDTVLAPDVAFVSAERLPPPEDRIGFLPIAPDLAVEVLPPRSDPGVRLIWTLDPRARAVTASHAAGRVRVYREGDVLDGGEVLPGFRVPVADPFR